MAALTFLASENGGMRSRSTTMALTFFDPIHRAHAAARRQAARAGRPWSLKANARDEALILPHRPAEADGDLLAVPLVQHVLGLEVALAEIRRGVVEIDTAVLLEVDDHPVREAPGA